MRIIADLHIHSKYSRAVSRDMTPENLDIWAQKKVITVIGTGDFTHPRWLEELKEKLEPAEEGLYRLRKVPNQVFNNDSLTRNESQKPQGAKNLVWDFSTRFLLTVEIAVIYSKGGKVRRIHHLVFAPSFAAVDKINKKLSKIGNLASDGRPILGLDSKELLKIVKDADAQAVLVPAHAWTPWFSVFGSMSGFDALEECFEELAPEIFAIETGLSSDPAMNWPVPALSGIALISNSDSHSLRKIGREANVFDCEFSYQGIMDAIESRDQKKFLYTIEFFPEEGKYHVDGHRDQKHFQDPAITKQHGGRCAQCGAKVTVGVLSRVEELASKKVPNQVFNNDSLTRNESQKPQGAKNLVWDFSKRIPYRSIVPLEEIIADICGVGVASKRVQSMYEATIAQFGSEFTFLLDMPIEKIIHYDAALAEAIRRVREGLVHLTPGYDGEYGKVGIFALEDRAGFIKIQEKQQGLF